MAYEPVMRLTTAQVAARLRVKIDTVYAYVSRGLLVNRRAEQGGVTFDPLEVELFAETRKRSGRLDSTAPGMSGRPLMVLNSSLTLIDGDELYFRGVSAAKLARTMTFDEAVKWLWSSNDSNDDLDSGFRSRPEIITAIRDSAHNFGPSARFIDRLKIAVMVAATWDPARGSIGPAAVRDAGWQMISTMVDSLPVLGDEGTAESSLAGRLWSRLSVHTPTTEEITLLNSTLVLCLDHDLAISTMAARVTASARADPYSALTAALSTFDSPMHGAASLAAIDMVQEAMETGHPEMAISRQIHDRNMIPGFGHMVYENCDPRARFLLNTMTHIPSFHQPLHAANRLTAVVAERTNRPANLDLALAVLVIGADMHREAGELIFALGRTAGWIAHMIDEYKQLPLRLRPEARYTGPGPEASI